MPLDRLPEDWPRAQLVELLGRAGLKGTFHGDDQVTFFAFNEDGSPMSVRMQATAGALNVVGLLAPMDRISSGLARYINDTAIDGPWGVLAWQPSEGLLVKVGMYIYPTAVPLGSTLRDVLSRMLEARAAALAGTPMPDFLGAYSDVPDVTKGEDVVRAFRQLLPSLREDGPAFLARLDYGVDGRWVTRIETSPDQRHAVVDAIFDEVPAWASAPERLDALACLNATLHLGAFTWWEGGRVVWRYRFATPLVDIDEHWAKLVMDHACEAGLAIREFEP